MDIFGGCYSTYHRWYLQFLLCQLLYPLIINQNFVGRYFHSSILAWSIPWTGAWRATVHGVTKSWTRLSNFTSFWNYVKFLIYHQTFIIYLLQYSLKISHFTQWIFIIIIIYFNAKIVPDLVNGTLSPSFSEYFTYVPAQVGLFWMNNVSSPSLSPFPPSYPCSPNLRFCRCLQVPWHFQAPVLYMRGNIHTMS